MFFRIDESPPHQLGPHYLSLTRTERLLGPTSAEMTGCVDLTRQTKACLLKRAPSTSASPSHSPTPTPQGPSRTIHRAWTPEVRINHETGEMNSVPGRAKVYSNGYPDGPLYVYNATARNVPNDLPHGLLGKVYILLWIKKYFLFS